MKKQVPVLNFINFILFQPLSVIVPNEIFILLANVLVRQWERGLK